MAERPSSSPPTSIRGVGRAIYIQFQVDPMLRDKWVAEERLLKVMRQDYERILPLLLKVGDTKLMSISDKPVTDDIVATPNKTEDCD